MLLRAATFTHWCFTQGRFYREELLHIDAQVLLHTDAFKQQCFYTHALLRRKSFDTEYPLHREAFTQILLRGGVFTHKYMYTEAFFTHRYPTDTFTKRCFARILLHRDAFTHRRF